MYAGEKHAMLALKWPSLELCILNNSRRYFLFEIARAGRVWPQYENLDSISRKLINQATSYWVNVNDIQFLRVPSVFTL